MPIPVHDVHGLKQLGAPMEPENKTISKQTEIKTAENPKRSEINPTVKDQMRGRIHVRWN